MMKSLLNQLNNTLFSRKPSRRQNQQTASRFQPNVETLEDRQLMSVGAWTSGSTLAVVADSQGGQVDVRSFGNTVQVNGPGRVINFDASRIKYLRFYGSAQDDKFTNHTSINSTIYGNAGNDELNGGKGRDVISGGYGDDVITGGSGTYSRTVCGYGFVVGQGIRNYCRTVRYPTSNSLYGGPGNDTLIGGSGTDRLYGHSGNDKLYGRGGTDYLYGGYGNDGLYGGSQNDWLSGGPGADRFLRYNGGGYVRDANWWYDVQITFSSEELPWRDREVEVVDQALEEIQNRAGGATWVLKDTLTGDPLVFTKSRSLGQYGGLNSVRWDWFKGYERRIRILDWNENWQGANNFARATVIHEIGHNWDGTDLFFTKEWNPYWNRFVTLHNQSTKNGTNLGPGYSSPDFARNYGQKNAKEDWATVWEMSFGYTGGPSRPSALLQEKLALVDAFFRLNVY